MRLWALKQMAMFAVAAVLIGGARIASADAVSFSTLGAFTAEGTDISGGNILTASSGGSHVTASFLPSMGYFSTPPFPSVGSNVRLAIGTICITPFNFLDAPLGFDAGDRFQLTLNEIDPFAPDSATVSSTIDGSVSFTRTSSDGGTNTGAFTFNFLPDNSVTINAANGRKFFYSLENVVINVSTNVSILGSHPSTGTLYLDVSEIPTASPDASAVPLPRTATMGLSLLAATAIGMMLRRRVQTLA
jgi:hypothetical protein